MLRVPALRLWPLAVLLVACSEKSPDPGDEKPKSDVVIPLEIKPGDFVAEKQPMKMLGPGDAIQLVSAPQGGHVIHIGARVKGLGGDVVNIQTRLLDPTSHEIRMQEGRDIVMKPVPGEPEWKEPDLRSVSQVTHIPACPNYDVSPILDAAFDLEVVIQEVDGPGQGSSTLAVKPGCLQTDPSKLAQCKCECEPNYALGKCTGT
ncbi:MAG: hypothetical protein U0263_07435 [Polyangiaceae bacterium]